MSIILTYLLF